MPKDICPRLIEVALPVREISAESVRDKSLRYGHISTLHLWWARRPLAAARAVVFASVVPDPDDQRCSDEFRSAISRLLKDEIPPELKFFKNGKSTITDPDPYKPYDGINDTPRNRLITFIAKWSAKTLAYEKGEGKRPEPKELLDDRCLVKWETSNPSNWQGKAVLHIARELIEIAHDGRVPVVLDPFAGGGAIPLEAARLGCRSIAGDYNPVAYLILRAVCEFPQKHGKSGKRKVVGSQIDKASEQEVIVENVLVHDLKRFGNKIIQDAKQKIGQFYPKGNDDRDLVGYLWVRTIPCSNPSCRAVFPLLRTLLLCDRDGKRVALGMTVKNDEKKICYSILHNEEISETEGTKPKAKGPVKCPFCKQNTSEAVLRQLAQDGKMREDLVAVIVGGKDGKNYRLPEDLDRKAFIKANEQESIEIPERIQGGNKYMSPPLYGMLTWGALFNCRQKLAMQTFIDCFHKSISELESEIKDDEYRTAIELYLGIWLSRCAMRMTTVGRWDIGGEKFQSPFDAQAIPMKWDYPEANPFSSVTGGFSNQLSWIIDFLKHEQNEHTSATVIQSDAASLPVETRSVDYVVTDPPYFDSIAYSDLSDFFYVWLKRALNEVLPEQLVTPLTPKSEEATALRHRHNGDVAKADEHFRNKLTASLAEARRVLKEGGLITVMFAHQSTKAWTALIESLLRAGLTIDSTWAIETELKNRAVALGASALESSITVACKPRIAGSTILFKNVRKEIEDVVKESVQKFWNYGLRGADLIVACYGPAVGVFGNYERVEKTDGTTVDIPQLLQVAKEAARDAIAGEFRGDPLSTLYYVWANLYGALEQPWDDARLVVQIGGDVDSTMKVARSTGIFEVDGSKCRLGLLADRSKRRGVGLQIDSPLIDILHRSMMFWKQEKRAELIQYLKDRDLLGDGPFWKLAQALWEVLPRDLEDWKIANVLLNERQTLRMEAKTFIRVEPQQKLFE